MLPHQHSYHFLRAAYQKGSFLPTQVTEAALRHADEAQQNLNAFAFIDHERALSRASASDKRWQQGQPLSILDGMPITIKEFAAVKGWSTRKGSLLTSSEPALQSAIFVQRLLDAGAVLLGKTRAPEFNWKGVTDSPGYGITRNPLNLYLTPGGSSGGCSAAVAAGVVRVSLGSDAGGSVRIPAAFTGTIGFKPSFGCIPMTPLPSAFFNMVNVGPIAASVSDLADAMHIVAGPDTRDWTSLSLPRFSFKSLPSATGLRIGLLDHAHWERSDPVIHQAFNEVTQQLIHSEFMVKPVNYDVKQASELGQFFYLLGCYSTVQSIPDNLKHQLDPALLEFIEPCNSIQLDDLLNKQQERDKVCNELYHLFDDIDILMLPTLPILPFEAGRNVPKDWPSKNWMSWNPFTPAFNLAQLPAISIPIWSQNATLPAGIQLVGPKGRDNTVLALAAWLEKKHPVLSSQPEHA